ncbi:iron-containing redox enzyme family protein [Vulcaniibacterium tengchongense]|uniref:3-oxoacyl-[acyl-carrier-protein] synthase-3 n=1 Tax=Vulcaniibacterium tengchongense TaxID=1273429 RepID=A0A3N4VER3_9GAMM|nr:3-oxoacyl-[acyl-carrier-protein] synthase III C-terminal domain-containing protein [Vulcaniibacterium tengchongense]RPE81148.1 3-oxoacyl-[acyl-carrier-protein] synthase-3 [Vulcaniibacterium tengchongense]
MPTRFERTWIHGSGRFLPGDPVDCEAMDAYVAPLNRLSGRIKRKILAENGILTRHYAIDRDGRTVHSCAGMAAAAIRDCLAATGTALDAVGLLACGTSGGDALMPGFASMVQGELAAPPMQVLSSHGICASGVAAWEAAAAAVELGAHARAVVAAAEMPSRLFKRSRYAARGYDADFDAHFLRWMLSDGAGALMLTGDAPATPLRLRLRFVHQRSFAGDYPVCMQLGLSPDRSRSHLDYDAWHAAEADGALFLRQDIRLLPHLFDVGVHEYARLAHAGWIDPARIDHFLCHYSSERFAPTIDELMRKAGLAIPRERWYSNLVSRGNTGAASIFIMLDEFLRTRELRAGERILCFIPESGRFTVAFALIEVEAGDAPAAGARAPAVAASPQEDDDAVAPPHDPADAPAALRHLLGELATIWHDYRSRVWRTPLIRKLRGGDFAVADYLRWMEHWIPQVREGSKWMREGAASVRAPYRDLAGLIETHAGDEQDDYAILFDDYRKAGGTVADIDALRRNPGGEALNAYLHALAATPNPIGLLGAIYVIEGTGQRIIPALLPLMKARLDLPADAFRFLDYHGANDEHHLLRWLRAVEIVLAHDADGRGAQAIVDTARQVAQLYLMQFQHVLPERSPG